jgi:hypothetical protein
MKITKMFFKFLIYISVLVALLWSLLIVLFGPWSLSMTIRSGLVAGILIFQTVLLYYKRSKKNVFIALIPILIIFYFFYTLKPSLESNWQADVGRLPEAHISGDLLKVKNIRNFKYRSENDYDVNYYDQEYDLTKIAGVDLLLTYWGDPKIAHVMLTFRFTDKKYLTISIEARKQIGEEYSAVKGFFRNYELIYVVADEEDVVKLRTNYRKEHVYLYHLVTPPERARLLLESYLKKIKKLSKKPEFYNAFNDNCTTNVYLHFKSFQKAINFSYKVLLSGYLAEYIYGYKGIYTGMPFSELEKVSYINPKAELIKDGEKFSEKIREGLPKPIQKPIQ